MTTSAKLKAQLRHLPDPILQSKRFLVWKLVPVEGKKPRKIPYYASGLPRGGTRQNPIPLDTPQDISQLTTLNDALASVERGGFAGIGLALVGEGVGAFDLDHCLTPDGDLDPTHPGAPIVAEAEANGAYIEISPSGRGLRILGQCNSTDAYSKGGLEYWGAGRYVTVTGSVWSGEKGWADLDPLREPLGSSRKEKDRDPDNEEDEPIVSRRVLDELRSALEVISSDERELWVRMGMALKTIGERGKDLWMEWSAKSDLFDEADAHAKWDTFRPKAMSFKAVFNEAKDWGWENPRSKGSKGKASADPDQEDDTEEDEPQSILDRAIDLGAEELYPTEFVVDGFLPVGVTLVAGAWGAGKSTNLIPLFASVCHLAPEEWGFRPQLRRHVIWITEAPDQARDTLYSIAKAEGAGTWDEFKKWFHLIPARRKSPRSIAASLAKAVEGLTYTIEPEEGSAGSGSRAGFPVKPVVVLDTTSANLDLENESDNSEVGAAMAALKEKLPGIPTVLIGHTPKALVKSDVADMTFRGAGAWEADAVATYYLVFDADTGMRFMAVRKARFTPDFTEISFGQDGGREILDTPWGEPQSKAYMHGVPERSNGEDRKAAQKAVKEERKEIEKERGLTDRQTRILQEVSKGAEEGLGVTKATLRENLGGKNELLIAALSRLLESGLVISVKPPADILELLGYMKAARPPELLLPSEVDPEVFYESIRDRRAS